MFSVVIPLYNKEAHITQTLHSVLQQSFGNFEVIVVDDGSKDGSLRAAQSIGDPRLKVYSKKNGGVSEARNFGIKRAQNEYIAFLDADDCWEPNYLEEMAKLIARYPNCGLYASAYKRVTRRKVIFIGNQVMEGIVDDYFKARLQHRIPWSSAVIVRKNVLDAIGGFPIGMISGEDDYTWSKIAMNYKIAFTPKILAIYNDIYATFVSRRGKLDHCKESWFDFYREGNFYNNEFVAKKAIAAGIRYAFGCPQEKSKEIERRTQYTTMFQEEWRYLHNLNRTPYIFIKIYKAFLPFYQESRFRLGTVKRRLMKAFFNDRYQKKYG